MKNDQQYYHFGLSIITYIIVFSTILCILFSLLGFNLISLILSIVILIIYTRMVFNLSKGIHEHFNQSDDLNSHVKKNENTESHTESIPMIEVMEDKKIILTHLLDRHNNTLSYVDKLDAKISQIIALNGLILSFIFFRANEAISKYVYIYGLGLIIFSIILGLIAYTPRSFSVGLSPKFFNDFPNLDNALQQMVNRLTTGIEKNQNTQNIKAEILRHMVSTSK